MLGLIWLIFFLIDLGPDPSETPTPAITITPTLTQTPTITDTPTATGTATFILPFATIPATPETGDFCYFSPVSTVRVEYIEEKDSVYIIGKNDKGDWLQIRLKNLKECWIEATSFVLTAEQVALIPIVPTPILPTSTFTPTPTKDKPTPTPTPTPTPNHTLTAQALAKTLTAIAKEFTMSVSNISGQAKLISNTPFRWVGEATITVVNGYGQPLDGVTVTGKWTSGNSQSCTTKSNGKCTITSSQYKNGDSSAVFTITNLIKSSYTYGPGDTQVQVSKPQ